MKAMILSEVCEVSEGSEPLKLVHLPDPVPGERDLLVKISACGVCHTELDEIEGRTPPAFYPVIPGHQVVGQVVDKGRQCSKISIGDRVGIAWIFSACGSCSFCMSGLENLCDKFKATGRDAHGGYAEYMTVNENYAHLLPDEFTDIEAAPLLCAGAIGYRSLELCHLHDGDILGLSGFGGSAHIVMKMVREKYPQTRVIVLARNEKEREFALQLGAAWAGDFGEIPPYKPHAIIDTTPAWKPVLDSLALLERGGRLVINAIRKEDRDSQLLAGLHYPDQLWMEKEVKSVANVTRRDVREFLDLAAEIPLHPEVETYPIIDANKALVELRLKKVRGAKVLTIS